ncbi:MAG: RraA family protein [Mesorhizobium sp.]
MPPARSHYKVVIPSYVGGDFSRPAAEDVATIAVAEVTDVSELVGAMYTMDGSIRPIAGPAVKVCGIAVTAKCPPGDNQAMIRALTEVKSGDVLVVDAKGFSHWCLGGYLLLQHAQEKYGLAGFIVNGAYRDVEDIRKAGFPVYATGISAYSGPKLGPGEINVPVVCGGVVVQPGDIVSASSEGVTVVPQRAARAVADALVARKAGGHGDIGAFVASMAAAFDAEALPTPPES